MAVVKRDLYNDQLLEWTVEITKARLGATVNTPPSAEIVANYMEVIHKTLVKLAEQDN